jgi:predicted GH43/DUF377 family glycosyl hydrolase
MEFKKLFLVLVLTFNLLIFSGCEVEENIAFESDGDLDASQDQFILDKNETSDINLKKGVWEEYQNNPVISYEDLKENLLFIDPSVIKEDGVYKMWHGGGEPFSGDIQVGIYYSESKDGIHWETNPTPVLENSEMGWDSKSVETPSVIKVGGTYHMYYTGYEKDFSLAIYSIGHATSSDGVTWVKDPNNPIVSPDNEDPTQWGFYTVAEPGVAYFNDEFHLYYASAKSNYPGEGSPFGIMHATSNDGFIFTNNDIVLELDTKKYSQADYRGYSTPEAFVYEDELYLYHGLVFDLDGFDQIAISSVKSSNGIDFDEYEIEFFKSGEGDWKDEATWAPTIIVDDNQFKLWFNGQTSDPEFNAGIGYASKLIN